MVSFDFDATLTVEVWDPSEMDVLVAGPNHEIIAKLREHAARGDEVLIVTSRLTRFDKGEVAAFVAEHNLPVTDIHFTEGEDKVPTLLRLGVTLHFEDDQVQIDTMPESIEVVQVPEHPSFSEVT